LVYHDGRAQPDRESRRGRARSAEADPAPAAAADVDRLPAWSNTQAAPAVPQSGDRRRPTADHGLQVRQINRERAQC
jgi:hypothetical protein